MLIRISLIVAIIAGLAVGALNFVKSQKPWKSPQFLHTKREIFLPGVADCPHLISYTGIGGWKE